MGRRRPPRAAPALTGERQGYYADFGSLERWREALQNGFFHDGDLLLVPRPPARPAGGHRGDSRLAARGVAQTHDQVGNRAPGDRPSRYLTRASWRSARRCARSPYTPMLFMGEEWGASTPWQFFTRTRPGHRRGDREGRKAEFAEHGWAGDVPDPQDPQTFRRSKLDWDEADRRRHARLRRWYRDLIALRRANPTSPTPRLDHMRSSSTRSTKWIVLHRGRLAIACNLGADAGELPVTGQVVLAWGTTQPGATTTTLAGCSFAVLRK